MAAKTPANLPDQRGRFGEFGGKFVPETLMAALVGCTNVITHKLAHKHGVDIKAMQVRLEAQFDRRGVTLQEEVTVPFPEIKLVVDITTDAPREAVETVRTELAKYCPVSKMIRESGTVINEEWNIIPA